MVLWLDVGGLGRGAGKVRDRVRCGRASPLRLATLAQGRLRPGQPRRLSPHRSGDYGDGAVGADEEGSTGGVGAYGVELDAGFLRGTDASGVLRRGGVVEEHGPRDEETGVVGGSNGP